jgi:hypothetical protein
MTDQDDQTPLELLVGIMCDETVDFDSRFKAAQSAAPYLHPKLAAMAKLFPSQTAEGPPQSVRS